MLVGAMGVVRFLVGGERWCPEEEQGEVAGRVGIGWHGKRVGSHL